MPKATKQDSALESIAMRIALLKYRRDIGTITPQEQKNLDMHLLIDRVAVAYGAEPVVPPERLARKAAKPSTAGQKVVKLADWRACRPRIEAGRA